MNILLFGKSGQVGWELQRSLAPLGRLISLDINSQDYCGDFTKTECIAETIRKIQPDVIVNAVAHTAVDKAETERELAYLLNVTTVETIAKEAEKIGALLVHYSTDYVFPGTGIEPWKETDHTAPLNFYGDTKLAGEKMVIDNCRNHLILRTSWVYACKGNNFAKTMLQLAKTKSELSVINDQFGAPTGAELLADCTAHAIKAVFEDPKLSGVYNVAASGTTTWYDYTLLVISEARKAGLNLTINEITAVPSSSYPTVAKRPYNSRLNTEKFQKTFNLFLPEWELGVKRMLNELISSNLD